MLLARFLGCAVLHRTATSEMRTHFSCLHPNIARRFQFRTAEAFYYFLPFCPRVDNECELFFLVLRHDSEGREQLAEGSLPSPVPAEVAVVFTTRLSFKACKLEIKYTFQL